MTVSVPPLTHRAPRHVVAGDSIEFLVAIPSAYSGWTGSARLTGADNAVMAATSCAAEGSDFHVYFVGNAGTSKLPSGHYQLTVWASDGTGRRVTLEQITVSLAPDLSAGFADQPRAFRTLAAIEAAIDARVTGQQVIEEYTVDGTATRKASLEELERLRNKYAAEVSAIINARRPIGSVEFAFGPSGTIPSMRHRFPGAF